MLCPEMYTAYYRVCMYMYTVLFEYANMFICTYTCITCTCTYTFMVHYKFLNCVHEMRGWRLAILYQRHPWAFARVPVRPRFMWHCIFVYCFRREPDLFILWRVSNESWSPFIPDWYKSWRLQAASPSLHERFVPVPLRGCSAPKCGHEVRWGI